MKEKKINNLTFGLFMISPKYPISFIKNTVKDFFIMLKRIRFVIRNGYYPMAHWETFEYMTSIWQEIFTWYRNERTGSSILIDPPVDQIPTDEWSDENARAVDRYFDKMLANLAIMNIEPEDLPQGFKTRDAAKDRFFKLFSDIFYDLWD